MFPAARLTDPCGHGGTIVGPGAPTVLINNQPAAVVGDMHTCPAVTGTVPHVGGPITMGANTILIMGKPAARVTSQCTCTGPPDVIALGEPTVLYGDGGSSP